MTTQMTDVEMDALHLNLVGFRSELVDAGDTVAVELVEKTVAALSRLRAEIAELRRGWQPIETAPRNSGRLLVAYKNGRDEWRVHEAWWRTPHEDANPEQCWWCYDGDCTLLSADVHTDIKGRPLGATHWMPLPAAPEPQPAAIAEQVEGEK